MPGARVTNATKRLARRAVRAETKAILGEARERTKGRGLMVRWGVAVMFMPELRFLVAMLLFLVFALGWTWRQYEAEIATLRQQITNQAPGNATRTDGATGD